MLSSMRVQLLGVSVIASLPACTPPPDSKATDAAVAPSAAAATTPSAPITAQQDAGRCAAVALQPSSCLPFGSLRAKDTDQWASQHGVKFTQSAFGERSVEGCEEVQVGLPNERALACVVVDTKPVDKAAGMDGPMQVLYSLVITEPSQGRLVMLADLPVAVAESDVLFHVTWKLDTATRQVTLDAPPAECASAPEGVRAYWKRQPGAAARVQQLGSAADEKRIVTLCKSVGSHPLAPKPAG
jgi:hypothetical protein